MSVVLVRQAGCSITLYTLYYNLPELVKGGLTMLIFLFRAKFSNSALAIFSWFFGNLKDFYSDVGDDDDVVDDIMMMMLMMMITQGLCCSPTSQLPRPQLSSLPCSWGFQVLLLFHNSATFSKYSSFYIFGFLFFDYQQTKWANFQLFRSALPHQCCGATILRWSQPLRISPMSAS